jgi:hypothetical protein
MSNFNYYLIYFKVFYKTLHAIYMHANMKYIKSNRREMQFKIYVLSYLNK